MSSLNGLDRRLDKALMMIEDHTRRMRQDAPKLDISMLSEAQQERIAQFAHRVDLDTPRPFAHLSDNELDELYRLAQMVTGECDEQSEWTGSAHDEGTPDHQ